MRVVARNNVLRLQEAFNLNFTQAEVDFVIPNLLSDLPLCIDPFLLFKSRDPYFATLHDKLVSVFNQAISLYKKKRIGEIKRLIHFPEVNEIGFGYTEGRIKGSGLGDETNQLLVELLSNSEAIQERGLKHIEELQLICIGVGADRISDISANILKSYLIDYTQQQANLWNIPLTSGVPVHHYFDFDTNEWLDNYFDLPKNPISGQPILLVPRRIVRLLPWINYDDYLKTEFKMFLNPKLYQRFPRYPGMPKEEKRKLIKQEVVKLTREQLNLLDHYVARKEREATSAEPLLSDDQFSLDEVIRKGNEFINFLETMPLGRAYANEYQRLVFEILNFLFEPELTSGQLEVQTVLGTERRDIIYTNEAETSFWKYVRETYSSLLVMFEVKNVERLEIDHINQTANYLGVRLGMLGFVVTRNPTDNNIIQKTYSVFNDTPSNPRKTIIIITDENLKTMIRSKQSNEFPYKEVQTLYRRFRTKIQ